MSQLSRRYARALLLIGLEDKSVDKLDQELGSFLEVLNGSADLKHAITDPTMLPSAKRNIVDAVAAKLGFSEPTKNFMSLLAEKGRLPHFEEIRRDYRALADQQAGRMRAKVTSAMPIARDVENAIAEKLSGLTGRKVDVESKVDAELLGGLVTEIGGKIYDGSLRTQLRQLRETARG